MERRNFIRKTSLTLVSATGLLAAIGYLRQFFPRSVSGGHTIILETPEHYPTGTYTFVRDHELFIYRDHEGISALSAVCTHLGCMVRRTTDGFECPCHGSCYDNQGKVVSGPASRDISWFQVDIVSEGRIRVDRNRVVPPGEKCLTYRS